MDDFDAVLAFLNIFFSLHGLRSRLHYFLSTQHVQYKLFFEHLVFLLEVDLTGHVNFLFLQQFGNLFVLLAAIVLWRMFRPPAHRGGHRLLLFAPVLLLFFAPRYGDTVNWAMGSLQNLTVVFFSLAAIDLVHRRGRAAFAGACASLVLAIASSGNGFFLACVGLLALLQQRRRSAAMLWTLATLVMAALYSYHYNPALTPSPFTPDHPAIVALLFPFTFLGAALGRIKFSVPFALLLLAFAGLLLSHRWRRRDPATFYAVLFILITAFGVDITRHQFGLDAALALRYTIYSQLFVGLLYMAALNLGLDRLLSRPRARLLLLSFAAIAAVFCLVCDLTEIQRLDRRTSLIRSHYIAWRHDPLHTSLVPDEDPSLQDPGMLLFRHNAAISFVEAERRGLYHPPNPASVAPVPFH